MRSRLRTLSQRLAQWGHAASAPTVSRLLKTHDEALHVTAKEQEAGAQHPDRDAQVQYIEAQKLAFVTGGCPIMRVDTTKQAWIGDFKNAAQVWCQRPIEVNVHDFPGDALGRAVPYGIYDRQRHHGAVYVGCSGATSEFAVTAMARWWEELGPVVYPQAMQLLIVADAGGSHGCRPRRWNAQLPCELSDCLGRCVPVGDYPTGGSKWNPIAQRVCSQISLNWAGQPVRTVETMLG